MTGYTLDPNDMAKTAIATLLGEVPIMGGALSGMVAIFWPDTKQDVWGEIRSKVEALVDEKISEEVYEDVFTTLQGLKGTLNAYEDALVTSKGNPDQLFTVFYHTKTQFDQAAPHFQLSDHRLLLLPLFVPFVGMHLALLRDLIFYGADFGLNENQIADEKVILNQRINQYSEWALESYQRVAGKFPLIDFHRQMTLSVMDQRAYWPYFHPDINPGAFNADTNPGGRDGILPPLVREVFFDLGHGGLGYPLDSHYLTYSWNQIIKPRLTRIKVIKNDIGLISGFSLLLAGEWQHNEITAGTASILALDIEITASNPIIRVTGSTTGRLVNTLMFHYKDGTSTQQVGGPVVGVPFNHSVPGHVLRALYLTPDTYANAGTPANILCAGFCYPESLYDDQAAIVDIKFKNWQEVDTAPPKPTVLDAAKAARDLNSRLVTPSEVLSAWKHSQLNVLGYALIEGGFLAVPLQADYIEGNIKRGPNIGITGGNQGFLYTPL